MVVAITLLVEESMFVTSGGVRSGFWGVWGGGWGKMNGGGNLLLHLIEMHGAKPSPVELEWAQSNWPNFEGAADHINFLQVSFYGGGKGRKKTNHLCSSRSCC